MGDECFEHVLRKLHSEMYSVTSPVDGAVLLKYEMNIYYNVWRDITDTQAANGFMFVVTPATKEMLHELEETT